MVKAIIFGGTTEGRKLCEYCSDHTIPVLYCTATTDGARQVEGLPHVRVQSKRMDGTEMAALLDANRPALVVDATHPYAEEASRNIAAACVQSDIRLIRVRRDGGDERDGVYFPDMDSLMAWLTQASGNIFVTTGVSGAGAFARLPDYQTRVWLRILPNIDSLQTCLELGYRADRLICMQGPFSEELNRAMFKAVNAEILVTKDSGAAGGFGEKIRAAGSLEMKIAVLRRPGGVIAPVPAARRLPVGAADPEESVGIMLTEACTRMMELRL